MALQYVSPNESANQSFKFQLSSFTHSHDNDNESQKLKITVVADVVVSCLIASHFVLCLAVNF